MEIKRTVTETLTDDNGDPILPGCTILYSQKTSTDNVGIYQALKDGFMVMKGVTTGKDYALRPRNITACRVIEAIEL